MNFTKNRKKIEDLKKMGLEILFW